MDRATALSHVSEVLAGIAPEVVLTEVDSGQPLREEADIDSMDFLRLLTGLAERTGVEIAEADYPRVATLDGLLGFLAAGGPAAEA